MPADKPVTGTVGNVDPITVEVWDPPGGPLDASFADAMDALEALAYDSLILDFACYSRSWADRSGVAARAIPDLGS